MIERVLLALACVLLAARATLAQDVSSGSLNYQHTSFTLADGAPAAIYAIAQGPDGYLWLGSEFGLYRYDGVTFEKIPIPRSLPRRSEMVDALVAMPTGDLLIGQNWGGVTLYSHGHFRDVTYPNYQGSVYQMRLAPDGGVWVASVWVGGVTIARYRDDKWELFDFPNRKPSAFSSFAVDLNGAVWVAFDDGLYVLKPGARAFEPSGRMIKGVAGLGVAPNGRLWVADALGVRDLDPHADPTAARGWRELGAQSSQVRAPLLFDQAGALWDVGASSAIARIRNVIPPAVSGTGAAGGRVDRFRLDRLTSPLVTSAFSDREGDVWIGTQLGLDRFRRVSIAGSSAGSSWDTPPFSVNSKSGLKGGFEFGVSNGFVSREGGSTYAEARARIFKVAGAAGLLALPQDVFDGENMSCAALGGGLWVFRRNMLELVDAKSSARVPLPKPPLPSAGCFEDAAGRLWVGSLAGVFRRQVDGWRRIVLNPAWPQLKPWFFASADDGSVLAYVANESLYRIVGDRSQVLWAHKDLSIGFVAFMEPTSIGVLIGGERGLARVAHARIQVLSDQRFPFLTNVTGVAEIGPDTWLMTDSGVVRLPTRDLNEAFDQPRKTLAPQIFSADDGLAGAAEAGLRDNLAKDAEGHLWISTNDGYAVMDPSHLVQNPLPPPVVIKSLIVDQTALAPDSGLVLPKGASKLEIDYAAPSLVAPNRVAFRYRLSGVDKEWVDPGQRRQAFYTNLPPGRYHFQVIAANNNGVWNKTGASVDFRIPPTFLQSNLFLALCAAAGALALWALYSARVQRLASRMQVRLEERLSERERIARELHDTLLQGVQGLVLRFQAVTDRLPDDQPAQQMLVQALERADDVLAEGRDRVRDLRSRSFVADLHQALDAARERLLVDAGVEAGFAIEGVARRLNPVAVDEIVKIAEEAMFNIARHAQASHAKVTVRYSRFSLTLRVWDDGVGLEPAILKAGGREGHFGLKGMRERAAKLRGTLSFASQPGRGATVVLKVPANCAYANVSRLWWPASWFRPRTSEC